MGNTINISFSRDEVLRFLRKFITIILSLMVLSGCQRVDPLASYAWLYQRAGQPVAASEETLTVIAVGDILLGRGVTAPEQAFAESTDWLSSADLTLGNLECALTDNPITATATLSHSLPAPVRLYAPIQAAEWLKAAGFDLLGLANNHSLDAGPDGLRQTAETLQAAGLGVVGAGANQEQALHAFFYTKNGVRLAILSVNAIPVPPDNALPQGQSTEQGWDVARWERQAVLSAVQTARPEADAVIVSIHWGYEYHRQPDPAQTRYAELLFEAGADVVIGHHPHVVQAPEVLTLEDGRTVLTAYSLGNFVFDQGDEEGTDEGLALRLVFDAQGLRAAQVLEVAAGVQPELIQPTPSMQNKPTSLKGGESEKPTPSLQSTYQCEGLVCAEAQAPQGLAFSGGVFEAGAADLDGDGQPETITLEGGRLQVCEPDGTLAWESPLRWLVVDAALGDPDWDGRPDLVAIFWKTDKTGVLRSHPFLIRQNGGRYEEVWGGSAVSEPIWEVEVTDLNGDGLDELAVLAMASGGSGQTLSVWEWHGWGFSQEWRSAPGAFENLRTAPGGWLMVK
jgi:poly-gamma-glutamate capsule biosynthesis protein CapA/YwtB (metallophosphatase superfamily)